MIDSILYKSIENCIASFYSEKQIPIQLQKTRKEFIGDITIVTFPLTKYSKKTPEDTSQEIGNFLLNEVDEFSNFNIIKGFLNIEIHSKYWTKQFNTLFYKEKFGFNKLDSQNNFVLEFSSPNTNKPLHLGHIRNNLLGQSIYKIIEASGVKVNKVQIINDRGIHICKSMVAWQDYGNNETPNSSGIKGDSLVGKYYIKFNEVYQKQIDALIKEGMDDDKAEKNAPILLKAQEMLLKWEAKDEDIIDLWKKLNGWVYEGFDSTYERLGIDFHKNYYESETYILGKKIVLEGLEKGIFFKKEDGSIWIDLTDEGFDEKLLLRSDGTAVYMTQDIGTAIERCKDFNSSKMIYVVGNEQIYHFQILFLILKKLGYAWAKDCYHLSYGMVDLPEGRMKSREGTVVDADDLMQEMHDSAKSISEELGKLKDLNNIEIKELYEKIGLGALKYFILKVDPKKKMLFDPKESIDFNGNTGPFIQYTYVRIQSVLNRYKKTIKLDQIHEINIKEKNLIKCIMEYPLVIKQAAASYNPSLVANYVYDLVKKYNNFYQSNQIIDSKSDSITNFRLCLSKKVGDVIGSAMDLLGIEMPSRM